MIFPSITDYKRALQSIDKRTIHLTDLVSINNENTIPKGLAGHFAVVFKMQDQQTKQIFALKCFIREQAQRKKYYLAIAQQLKKLNRAYFCEYQYLDNEFAITPRSETKETLYPVLKMAWVEGKTLGLFLKNKPEKSLLEKLYQNWITLCQFLQENKIAHGDLKHDNMIISPNAEITLIDYDGFFVPELSNQPAIELGSPHYQHPQRTALLFNEKIDYFPQLIIAISIKALSLKPKLSAKYNTGENILFVKKDFLNLKKSKLYKALLKIKEPELQRLLQELPKAIADFHYQPFFLKKSIITASKPQYFIFNIDYNSRIDKGNGVLIERIQNIIARLFISLNRIATEPKSIFYSTIEYHHSIRKEAEQRLVDINQTQNILEYSQKVLNFKESLVFTLDKLNRFKDQFIDLQKPIVINIIANKQQKYYSDEITEIKKIAQVYTLYISDAIYYPMIKYPDRLDNRSLYYQNLFKSSSYLEKYTRQALNENLNKTNRGLVIHANDKTTQQFLKAIILEKFT